MKFPPAFSNQYAASPRRPAIRIAERSLMPHADDTRAGVLAFQHVADRECQQIRRRCGPPGPADRRLDRIVDDVDDASEIRVPPVVARRCQSASDRSRSSESSAQARFPLPHADTLRC